MGKIIVLRPGALGDTILTLPALAALRRNLPAHHLTFVGNPSAISLISTELADRTISVDDACVTGLFSPITTPTADLRSLFGDADLAVLWLSRAEEVAANVRLLGARRVITASPKPAADGHQHAADHLLSTLGEAGRAGTFFPPIALAKEDMEFGVSFLQRHDLREQAIAIHPGSGGRWKCWPAERFAKVAAALSKRGLGIVLVAGPADGEAVALFKAAKCEEVAVVAEGLTLRQLAGVVRSCEGFIGNDSGVSHLAAALGVPTVAIYGATDPAVWGVRGPRVAFVGGRSLEDVSVEAVLDGMQSLCSSAASSCLLTRRA